MAIYGRYKALMEAGRGGRKKENKKQKTRKRLKQWGARFWGQKQFKKGVFLGVLWTFFEEKGRFWRGDLGKLCRDYSDFRGKIKNFHHEGHEGTLRKERYMMGKLQASKTLRDCLISRNSPQINTDKWDTSRFKVLMIKGLSENQCSSAFICG